MDSKKFAKKVKLYVILHGNNITELKRMHQEERHCAECRKINEGICNVLFNSFTFGILPRENNKILVVDKDRTLVREFMQEWQDEYSKIPVSQLGPMGRSWKGIFTPLVDWETICFGFLNTHE